MSEKIENISPSIFVYFQLPTIPCNFLPFSTQTPVKYLYLSCICNWFCIWFYLGILVPDVRKSLQFAHESYSTPFPATFTAEISHSDQSLQHHLQHLLHHREMSHSDQIAGMSHADPLLQHQLGFVIPLSFLAPSQRLLSKLMPNYKNTATSF